MLLLIILRAIRARHRGSREAFRSAHCLPFIPPVYGLLPGTRDQTTDLVSPCPGGPVVNQVLCTWYLVTTNKPVCFGTEKKNGSWIIIRSIRATASFRSAGAGAH